MSVSTQKNLTGTFEMSIPGRVKAVFIIVNVSQKTTCCTDFLNSGSESQGSLLKTKDRLAFSI